MKTYQLVIILVALLILGATQTTANLPIRCISDPEIMCREHAVWTNGTLKMILMNNMRRNISNIIAIEGNAEKEWFLSWLWPLWYKGNCSTNKNNLLPNEIFVITCNFKSEQIKPAGDKQNFKIKIKYNYEGMRKEISKEIKLFKMIQ